MDRAVYLFGAYEPQELDIIEALVGPQDICLDIGCNTGQHALVMAMRAKEVHAFEPLEAVRVIAERRMAENAFDHITIHPFGLGETSRMEDFYFDDTSVNNAMGSFIADHDVSSKSIGQLEIRKGDEAVSDLCIPRVDFVKIDVEGFESEVIKGLCATFEKQRPTVMFEVSETAFREMGGEPVSSLFPDSYRFFRINRGKPVLSIFLDARPKLEEIEELRPEIATFNVLAVPSEKALSVKSKF